VIYSYDKSQQDVLFLKIFYQNKVEKLCILSLIIRAIVDTSETVGLRIMNWKEGIGHSIFDIPYRGESAKGSRSG
jgi:hypothetical protein